MHLELVVDPAEDAPSWSARVAAIGAPAAWRIRRGRGVVTWKSIDGVLTLLRRMGASASVLELESRLVTRQLHGHLNRVLNAEEANLSRAVRASLSPVDGHRGARRRRLAVGALGRSTSAWRGPASKPRRRPSPSSPRSSDMTRSRVQRALGAHRALGACRAPAETQASRTTRPAGIGLRPDNGRHASHHRRRQLEDERPAQRGRPPGRGHRRGDR